MSNPSIHTAAATATATATATAGSPSSKARETDEAIQQMKHWRLVGCYLATADHQVVAKLADNGESVMQWQHTPADLEMAAKARVILAIPAMVEALRMAHFGLTADADANDGTVDRAGVLGWINNALAAAGVSA